MQIFNGYHFQSFSIQWKLKNRNNNKRHYCFEIINNVLFVLYNQF